MGFLWSSPQHPSNTHQGAQRNRISQHLGSLFPGYTPFLPAPGVGKDLSSSVLSKRPHLSSPWSPERAHFCSEGRGDFRTESPPSCFSSVILAPLRGGISDDSIEGLGWAMGRSDGHAVIPARWHSSPDPVTPGRTAPGGNLPRDGRSSQA